MKKQEQDGLASVFGMYDYHLLVETEPNTHMTLGEDKSSVKSSRYSVIFIQ